MLVLALPREPCFIPVLSSTAIDWGRESWWISILPRQQPAPGAVLAIKSWTGYGGCSLGRGRVQFGRPPRLVTFIHDASTDAH
jgi:hypothetical protein